MDEQTQQPGRYAETDIELICRRYCVGMGLNPDQEMKIPTGFLDHLGQQQVMNAPLWKTLRPNAISTLAWYQAIEPFI